MEYLVKEWEDLSEKLDRMSRKEGREEIAERLITESQTYAYCADRLKRELKK